MLKIFGRGDKITASKMVGAVHRIDIQKVCCATNDMKNGKASGTVLDIVED